MAAMIADSVLGSADEVEALSTRRTFRSGAAWTPAQAGDWVPGFTNKVGVPVVAALERCGAASGWWCR